MDRRLFLALLAPVLLLGAYLRLADLGGPSLWLDEILHLQVAQSLADEPWYRHLTGVREIKGGTENGPLYYSLQILGHRLLPGEAGARLFPAVLGILTLPLMAVVGGLLGGRRVALVATFLLAVSPLHVYFSREGRPYYLIMALALLLLWALLDRGSRFGVWVAYGGCLVAAYVGLHAVPILLSFFLLSAAGVWWSRPERGSLLRSPMLHYVVASILALGLAYGLYMTRSTINTPTLEKAESQVELQQSPVYRSPLSRESLELFLASMTTSGHPSTSVVGRSWVLVALSLAGLVLLGLRRPPAVVATAGMFFLPAALSIVALVSVGRWYGINYTSAALPAFLLLVALGIEACAELAARLAKRGPPKVGLPAVRWASTVALLLLFVLPNLSAARTDPQRKLDWRGIARFFDEVALEDEPILIPNTWPQICLGYYLQDLGRSVEFVNLWESAARGEAVVAERPRGWLLTAGFRKTNEVRAWMHRFVPVLKQREEEMALFFFPDLVTLLETRFAARKGAVFERQFEAMGRRFDFGGGETTLQGRGWSYVEEDEEGTRFQWALGEQAELGLPIGRPRRAEIRLRVLPFVYPGAAPQQLELWLDETRVAVLDLPEVWSEQRVEVPASSWSSGANILYLRFGRTARPVDVIEGSRDRRLLSAAFDYLEVVPAAPAGP